MDEILFYMFQGFMFCVSLFTITFFYYSIKEKEKRAGTIGLGLLLAEIILIVLAAFVSFPILVFWILDILIIGLLFLILLPYKNEEFIPQFSETRFDERNIIFSRNLLKEGTKKFDDYYAHNPDLKSLDEKFRSKPGLLKPGSKYYNQFLFSAANATFKTIEQLSGLVSKPSNIPEKEKVNPENTSDFISKWIKNIGAVSVGFTELKPYHLYSIIGRGKDYGKEVSLDHKYAIAFTVEMGKDSMDHAPYGPVVLESSQQYLNAGTMAVQLAEFIRNLGYEARAHIDADYRVICPLVAQDAGLGTIGRMGLLITPQLGPRVRIAVVTSNIPLRLSKSVSHGNVISFCRICRKCAKACPPKAIPFGVEENIGGINRWKINSESCFSHWCSIGTDCGICIRICPYSHPNNFIHNFIRFLIKRNSLNRWFFLKLDNLFYGSKLKSKTLTNWITS